jgi:hypothetical protein
MANLLRLSVLGALVACTSPDAAPSEPSGPSDPSICTADAACTCRDGSPGTERCAADGSFAACACTPGTACAEPASDEYCDGLDNDCNGVVDDGEVCPDATVASTVPLAGGVYFQGTLAEGSCADAIERFWPSQDPAFTRNDDCYVQHYQFRRSDHALYFQAVFEGLHLVQGNAHPIVATPPCDAMVGRFDFDAAGTLHYQCGATVYRAGGTIAAQDIDQLVGVLDDGRMLVTRRGAVVEEYAVLDAAGAELSRPSLAGFTGALVVLPDASTVAGDRAYVAYRRHLAFGRQEIVVFSVDEHSAWHRVRRVEIAALEAAQLVTSDGTVFLRGYDPDNPTDATERILAYLPDGTTRVAWREVDSMVKAHIGNQLLIGPP